MTFRSWALAFFLATTTLLFAGRVEAQAVVDLTPPTGTAQTTNYFFNTRGYTVTFSTATFVSGIDLDVTLGVNDTYFAHIWDDAGNSVAIGSTVNGTGAQTFYRSTVNVPLQANVPYRIVGYVSNTGVSFPNKLSPTFPYTVGNITISADWSGVVGDTFPTNSNIWGPSFRVVESQHISVAPDDDNFGNQRVGTTSANQPFIISNTAGAPLVLNSLIKAGPFNVVGLVLPLVMAPSGFVPFTINFAPVGPGLVTGAVVLSTNDPLQPTYVISLSGTGTVSHLSLAPSPINFGNQTVSTVSLPITVTITNTGTATLNISSGATVVGPYQVAGLGAVSLAPNATSTFTVMFAPTVGGFAPGSIQITSDDPNSPATLNLTGVGTASGIAASPNPVLFGTQPIGGAGVTQTITLTNTGNTTLNISGLAVGGANAGDFNITVAPTLPAAVPPNSGALVRVLFKPLGHGSRAAMLNVTSDALGTPVYGVLLNGFGSGPQLVASPSPLDFGGGNINTTINKSLTISNTGEAALLVSNFTFAGANATDFSSTTAVPFTVPAGGSVPISINWKSPTVGARSGTIVVTSNDPLNPATQVNLTALAEAPQISALPSSIDFGNVLANTTSQPLTVTVTNNGDGPLTISSATLGGRDATQFQFTPGPFPVVIAPNGTNAYSVTFAPNAVGAFIATLTLLSDDPTTMSVVVPIRGGGVSPAISVDQQTIAFGAQLVNRVSQQRVVTVTNSGTAPLTLSQIALSGAQLADFAIVNPPALPVVLQPGEMKAITLTLTASTIGLEAAKLTVQSDDPATPQVQVTLTGMGVSTLMSVSPAMVDFGTIKAPGNGVAQMISITNSGGDPMTLLDATLTGAAASAFNVGSAAGVLAPGASKTVSVNVTVTTAGDLSATATFATSDATIPKATVLLLAKGVSMLLAVAPSTLDFGMVAVGTTSATQMVTVTNASSSTQQLMTVSASDPSFVVTGADTMGAIAPGATTSFSVAFAPSVAGAKSGGVSITLSGAATPDLVVMVTGTGVIRTADAGADVTAPDGNGSEASVDAGASDAGASDATAFDGSDDATETTASASTQSGGCGCRIATRTPSWTSAWALGALGIGLIVRLRRRSKRAQSAR